MPVSSHRVKGLVDQVRARWRRRAFMQGLAVTLLVLVFFAALLILLYLQTSLSIGVLLIIGALGVLGTGYAAVKYLVLPITRKLEDQKIALYIEERIPGLQDRLNSAVELGQKKETTEGGLLEKLLEDATKQVRAIPVTTVVDRSKERLLTIGAAGVVLLFLVFGYSASDEILSAFSGAQLTLAATPEEPYMTIEPGNVEIERGESQDIIVDLRDETENEVLLHYKVPGGEWQKVPMTKGMGSSAYLYELINMQEPMQYFILHDDMQSEAFEITLYEFPAVQQINLRYTYPSYTGVPARSEPNTGDIRGLKGTSVSVTINTSGNVETAEMVLDDGRRLPLRSIDGGQYRVQLTLKEDTYYKIELQDQAGKSNKFPEEYQIIVEDDQKPKITVTDPQQDVRVNSIDEVLVAAEVTDDYGIQDVRLHLSVNGEDEEIYRLMKDEDTRSTTVTGDYIVFLEDYTLEPGDVISYYIEGEDFFEANGSVASDMYFIEVIPFDQQYTQQNNMAGGGGGGGMQSRTVISQQEIIAATWKLHRQKDERSAEDFDEARKGLVQAQINLKLDIEDRINSTTFALELRTDEDMQKIVEHLRAAVEAMDDAVVDLESGDLQKALGPERKALNELLKADAMNREREVTRQQPGQPGGGGGGAMEDRMTELMDLELDISRDKYEIQQQRSSSQQQQQQEMDQALDRIKELARRQQRIANQQQRELEGEDKKRYIERLRRDQEELREQTEQLSQQMQQQSQSQSGEAAQRMREGLERATERMRDADRALRNGDEQRAAASQQQALNELDQLQRELQIAGAETTREMLDDLSREFDDFQEQEEKLGEDIRETFEEAMDNGGRLRRSELEDLQEKRRNMVSKLDQFEQQAEAIERAVRGEDPEVASDIRNMLQQMRRDELEKSMDDSDKALQNGWLDYAERRQEDIEDSLDRMATQMQEIQNELPQTDEEQLRRALSDLQNIQERLEALQRQAESESQSEAQSSSSSGQAQGGNRDERARASRMQRELDRAEEAMERMQNQLEGNEGMERNMQRAMNSLRNVADASNRGVLLDDESAKSFFNKDVFQPFSELERQIALELDAIEMEKKLFGARKAEVPDEYRDTVDRYYESLSKSNNK